MKTFLASMVFCAWFGSILGFIWTPLGFAEVVFSQKKAKAFIPDRYPPASFGKKPYRPHTGFYHQSRAGRSLASVGTSKAAPRRMYLVPKSTQGVQERGLVVTELGFFPKTLFVTQGIPVRIFLTTTSKLPLCFMMDAFQIFKQVKKGALEEVMFTAGAPGQYRFYCPIDGQEGFLIVKEQEQIYR